MPPGEMNGGAPPTQPKDGAGHLPEAFFFDIGGYGARGHQVEFKDGRLWHRTGVNGFARFGEKVLEPTVEEWERFWRGVERAAVWSWKADYLTDVLDGTQWSLRLQHAGRSITTAGSNDYPGGVDNNYSPTSEFAQFLRALEQLTGVEEIR